MVYVTEVVPTHGTLLPAIAPGVAGTVVIGVKVKVVAGPEPQLFMAATETVPEPVPEVTVIDVVP